MASIVEASKEKIIGDLRLNLSDAETELLTNINNSLASISSGVNFSFTDIISWVIPAVVGALSAYWFNKFHWQNVEKEKKISSVRVALCEAIEKLENTSIKYWASDYSEKNSVDCHLAELSIVSNFKIIRRYIRIINEYNDKAETAHTLDRFVVDNYNLITGDGFESKDRKSSKVITNKVSSSCANILSILYMLEHQK